jgi:hypothetical protein
MTCQIADWEWWWGAWRDRIRCPQCRALMATSKPCPICGFDCSSVGYTEIEIDGEIHRMAPTFEGPLDWSPYAMLQLMHRDWLRPFPDATATTPNARTPSPRALVVVMFWTYFEALMTWYFEVATASLPPPIAADLLTRYSSIGSRLDRLHGILFGSKYGDDLDRLGFANIRKHLAALQSQRNAFIHGKPDAIDDTLVFATARAMPEFHTAWIETFNLRCTGRHRS